MSAHTRHIALVRTLNSAQSVQRDRCLLCVAREACVSLSSVLRLVQRFVRKKSTLKAMSTPVSMGMLRVAIRVLLVAVLVALQLAVPHVSATISRDSETESSNNTLLEGALEQLRDVRLQRASQGVTPALLFTDPLDIYRTRQHLEDSDGVAHVLLNPWICLHNDDSNNDHDVNDNDGHNNDNNNNEPVTTDMNTVLTRVEALDNGNRSVGELLVDIQCYPLLFLPDESSKNSFRTVLRGQAVPRHCHVRMNINYGGLEARLLTPEERNGNGNNRLDNNPTINQTIDVDVVDAPRELAIRLETDSDAQITLDIEHEEDTISNANVPPINNEPTNNEQSIGNAPKFHFAQQSDEYLQMLQDARERVPTGDSQDHSLDDHIPKFTAKQKLTIQEKGVLHALMTGHDDSTTDNLIISGVASKLESALDIKTLEFIADLARQVDYGIEFAENHLHRLLLFQSPEKRYHAAAIIGNSASNNPIAAMHCLDSLDTLLLWVLDTCEPRYSSVIPKFDDIDDNSFGTKKNFTKAGKLTMINLPSTDLNDKADNSKIENDYRNALLDPYCVPLNDEGGPLIIDKDVQKLVGPDKKFLHKMIFTIGALLRSGTKGYTALEKLNVLYINIAPYYPDELERLIQIVNEVIRPGYLVFSDPSEELKLDDVVKSMRGPIGEIARVALSQRRKEIPVQ